MLKDMIMELDGYTKRIGHTDDVIRMIQLCSELYSKNYKNQMQY